MQNIFGSGILWGRQLTDASGAAISNPTPQKFGVLQEVSLDTSFDLKLLYGQNQFPVAAGRGKGKIGGKAKSAQINGALLNSIIFGQTLTLNSQIADYNDTTTGTAIPTTPFQITPTPPSSGTYVKDLGVRNAATGIPFVRVASGPTAGQYSVNESTGAYTFASADNVSGIKVLIDYQYSFTTGAGNTLDIYSLPMGYAPTFGLDLNVDYNGKKGTIRLYACVGSKFSMATKLDDFVVPEFDFDAIADPSGKVITFSWNE